MEFYHPRISNNKAPIIKIKDVRDGRKENASLVFHDRPGLMATRNYFTRDAKLSNQATEEMESVKVFLKETKAQPNQPNSYFLQTP